MKEKLNEKSKKISYLNLKKDIRYRKNLKNKRINRNIQDNISIIKKLYSSSINSDIVLREFNIEFNTKKYNSCIVFIDGIVNIDSINSCILRPLMNISNNINPDPNNLEKFIQLNVLYQNNIDKYSKINDIVKAINCGNCALFIDTLDTCFLIDVKQYEHRNVSEPVNENIVKGSHSSFVENIKSNSSLLRKIINNENLVLESINIGTRSNTNCLIGYISDIANPQIINEVRRRLNNISIDFLIDSGQLEQLIEDHPYLLSPQILSTERPDKVASHLQEGRVCIIVNNSPNVLVVPFTFWDFFHTPEDSNLKFQFGNFLRFIRIIAYFLSLLLPAFYIALTNFHIDLLPTDLLFSIAAIREDIPFPLLIEILIMEISFELIREASSRMPGSIGSSLGIVGAVLLGQASVDANLVSPLLIFVVAITGISSFATPNYSLALSFRILRFLYILLASVLGLFGVALAGVVHLVILGNMYTFLVPYFVSFSNYEKKPFTDGITILPIFKSSYRPPFLKSLDKKKSLLISRRWDKKKEG